MRGRRGRGGGKAGRGIVSEMLIPAVLVNTENLCSVVFSKRTRHKTLSLSFLICEMEVLKEPTPQEMVATTVIPVLGRQRQ